VATPPGLPVTAQAGCPAGSSTRARVRKTPRVGRGEAEAPRGRRERSKSGLSRFGERESHEQKDYEGAGEPSGLPWQNAEVELVAGRIG